MDGHLDCQKQKWELETGRRCVVRCRLIERRRFLDEDRRGPEGIFELRGGPQHAGTACHREQGDIDGRTARLDSAHAGCRPIRRIRLCAVVHRAGFVIAARAGAEFVDWGRSCGHQYHGRSQSDHLAQEPDAHQARKVLADDGHLQSRV